MHKRLSSWVVLATMFLIVSFLAFSQTRADTTGSDWLTSDLSLEKQDVVSPPSSINGNTSCEVEEDNVCAVATDYGAATNSGTVRLNNESFSLGDKGAFAPVYTYIENRQRLLPVPNSNTVISYTGGPVYGFYLYFNYDFSASITRTGGIGTLQPAAYHISRPPDGKLTDKSNRLLAADAASLNFSTNGQWMVVSDPNVAVLRVNLRTFEVLPFAPGFSYSVGLDPSVKTAISNDGRYAVVASQNFTTFKLYDLDTCTDTPATIVGPASCQSRDFLPFMQQQAPSFGYVSDMQFMNDDSLAFYAAYKSDGTNRIARFIVGSDGTISQLGLLGIGDSYISGEGAFDYVSGTDTTVNKCHLSYLSYPLLIGNDLSYDAYHSVACSGATTNDITNISGSYVSQAGRNIKTTRAVWDETGQSAAALSSFMPGYIDQLEFVRQYQPKTVVLSVGGNDADMIGTLKTCVLKPGTCFKTYEDRLEFVNDVNNIFPKIVSTYRKIKSAGPPDMRLYVIAYPQIAKPGGDCALNVHLDSDEVTFTAQAIGYLNSVVKAAAAKAGVYYVDTEDALYGHRLCEAGPGSVAMNGVTAGNDIPNWLNGPIGSESFHPNAFGHQLLENRILALTHKLSAPMPAADMSAALPDPDTSGILNAPRSGRAVSLPEYDPGLAPELAYAGTLFDVSLDGSVHSLSGGSVLTAQLHSDPVELGTLITGSDGNISSQLTLPANTAAGYHTIHLYGKDLTGQPIDIYKDIYVAATADDIDGNGVADSSQSCVGVEASGVDTDKDGIDDSCDADITQPPAPVTSAEPVQVSGTLTSASAANHAADLSAESNTNGTGAGGAAAANAPKVLGASISKKAQPSVNQDSKLHIQPKFYAAGGAGFLALSTVSYFFKRRWF